MLAIGFPALLLGLACGAFYSAADYFRKAVPAACPPETILFYYIGGQIPVLAAWAVWTGEFGIAPAYAIPGLIDAASGLGANLLFVVAIRRSALSLMVPMLALVPVVTLVFGGLALGEWPTPPQSAGIFLIAAGLFALFQPPEARPNLGGTVATLRAERGTLPMLGVVVLWAGTPALDKLCLASTSPGMHGLIQVSLIWVMLFGWALTRRGGTLSLPAGAVRPIAGSAVVGAFGYACQLLAYAVALVALIEVLKRAVGLLGSLVLGRAAFREPVTGVKIVGIAIVIAGLPLVMLT